MNLIIDNWYIFVGLVALAGVLATGVFYFFKQPSKKQLEQIKEWLLFAVIQSEKELGNGTGQVKLRFVYDLFLAKFKWIAYFMSFETFSALVDEALEEMRNMLMKNPAVNELVKGKEAVVVKVADIQ